MVERQLTEIKSSKIVRMETRSGNWEYFALQEFNMFQRQHFGIRESLDAVKHFISVEDDLLKEKEGSEVTLPERGIGPVDSEPESGMKFYVWHPVSTAEVRAQGIDVIALLDTIAYAAYVRGEHNV